MSHHRPRRLLAPCLGAALALALFVQAGQAGATQVETHRYTILRGDSEVGVHEVRREEADGQTRVASSSRIDVRLLGVALYRFRYDAKEVWVSSPGCGCCACCPIASTFPRWRDSPATEDVRFCDPFNDLRGIEPLRRLLAHTRRQVPGARFEVLDRAWSEPSAYLKWRMRARVKVIGDWRVEGMSEVRFDPDGRVAEHLDHWDAACQFYGRLPLLGPLLRWLGRPARVV